MQREDCKTGALLALATLVVLSLHVLLAPNPVYSNKQNIVIDAIPKSASSYIVTVLSKGLGYKRVNVEGAAGERGNLMYSTLEFYLKSNRISMRHFRAPNSDPDPNLHLGPQKLNVDQLSKYTDRTVVHLRDPRSVLLSLVHHVNEHPNTAGVLPPRPAGYYNLDLNAQIDWGIDNFLPRIVRWMQEWLAFKDQQDALENGFKVLITTYDELIQDELQMYYRLLAYYNIPLQNFKFTESLKGQVGYFRKGDPNEWRQVFSAQQQQRIAEIVPDSLLQRFNWAK